MKRSLAALLAGVMCLAMLAGCSKKNPDTPPAPDPAFSAPDAENGADPENPDAPGDPEHPDVPADPEKPDALAEPDFPADPDDPFAPPPGLPPDAAEPDQAGEVGEPEKPDTPGEDTPAHKPAGTEMIHFTVETVKISAADLKAANYTVPVLVTLDKNPGITYAEWGLTVDSRCTFTPGTDDMAIEVYFATNDEEHFIWTAWGSGAATKKTGPILRVDMKLPATAKAGDVFTLDYSDMSLGDKGHMFSNKDTDYTNSVGWENGGVKVT